MARAFLVRDEIIIHAPLDRCFLLSTSLALVARQLRMRPVRGRTTGLVVGGDTVRWKGWKFGIPQFHESLIEAYRPYAFFRDRMIDGRFARFEHDHSFTLQADGSVLLSDELRYAMRWGIFGQLLGRFVLLPHIRGLMKRRFDLLKRVAESDEWRHYLQPATSGILPGQTLLS